MQTGRSPVNCPSIGKKEKSNYRIGSRERRFRFFYFWIFSSFHKHQKAIRNQWHKNFCQNKPSKCLFLIFLDVMMLSCIAIEIEFEVWAQCTVRFIWSQTNLLGFNGIWAEFSPVRYLIILHKNNVLYCLLSFDSNEHACEVRASVLLRILLGILSSKGSEKELPMVSLSNASNRPAAGLKLDSNDLSWSTTVAHLNDSTNWDCPAFWLKSFKTKASLTGKRSGNGSLFLHNISSKTLGAKICESPPC